MISHLGRFLNKDEHVDHIDGDKLNDVIENLQILTPKENNIKAVIQNNMQQKQIESICPICGKPFLRLSRNIKYKVLDGKTPTCSRRCGGIKSHLTKLT